MCVAPRLFVPITTRIEARPLIHISRTINQVSYIRTLTITTPKMSFSNTDTGSKPADPYKEKNKEELSIKEKIEDLGEFVDACKFGMMTTRHGNDGALVSRCMALAGKVRSVSCIYIINVISNLVL
jgi:hypothetical protein